MASSPRVEPADHSAAQAHIRRPIAATPRSLTPLFWLAANAPGLARGLLPAASRATPTISRQVRIHTRRNAQRIFGRPLSPAEQRAFTRGVVSSFCEFILDVGRSSRETVEEILGRVDRVEGVDAYQSVRATGRGAVLVTAHMGSFEAGLAVLATVEPRIHVVYKRDATGAFESMRRALRERLGVIEAPIDLGMPTWIALRQSLLSNEVVVMQADRAMPGQKSAVVPFLHGHLRVPTGAVRLAMLTGSPIVPVFAVRTSPGRFAVHLLPAIEPGRSDEAPEASDSALRSVCTAIESMVARFPTQWLTLGAAFEEDAVNA